MKSDFRFESFIRKLRNIPLVYNLLIHGCPEKDRENYPKRLLNKGIKKPRLKSNPGVVLIGLQTTRPRPLAGKHCSKAKKHPY